MEEDMEILIDQIDRFDKFTIGDYRNLTTTEASQMCDFIKSIANKVNEIYNEIKVINKNINNLTGVKEITIDSKKFLAIEVKRGR